MNKKIILSLSLIAGLVSLVIFWFSKNYQMPTKQVADVMPVAKPGDAGEISGPQSDPLPDAAQPEFTPPLDRARERVSKKPFGLFVTPQNSPVQPERFHGYHTGTDFEIFADEVNQDVPVKAICSGILQQKRTATGYGGLAVQSCELDGQPITVVYGHLKLTSISAKTGQEVKVGETLGILGAGSSTETDGERKHLHLGIHKGVSVNILGYLPEKNGLRDWIDACLIVC